MKPVKLLCEPLESVYSSSKADTVANISDLISEKISADLALAERFFRENYVTAGMKALLTQVFDRLLGESPQGVFRLKQAMGGGKTHNLIALGLLAKHARLRKEVLAGLGRKVTDTNVRLVAFDGRETDTKDYLWVEIFRQLDVLAKWTGGATDTPGPTTWANVLGPEPVLIMLDELPPYLEAMSMSKAGADSTEADRVTIGLANLMNAIMTGKLPNCCLVVTDLISSWQRGSAKIDQAFETTLRQLHDEASRVSLDITPVRLDGTEVYAILRKRLFSKLPEKSEIDAVAKGYAKSYQIAIQQKVMPESLERWASQIPETYPFHPGMEDLIARFRENQGFQQTREVLRIARKMVANIWGRADFDPLLIHPDELDFNDPEVDNLMDGINASLQNARSHDVSKNGSATAEDLAKRDGSSTPLDAAKLIYISSLSTAAHATLGLTADEVAAYLCAPDRDVSNVGVGLLTTLEDSSWYLHRRTDGRWYFRDTKNVNSAIKDRAGTMLEEVRLKELKVQLIEQFKPGKTLQGKYVYQRLAVFPAIDDIELDEKEITLVIAKPNLMGLDADLRDFWNNQTYQNRIAILTGTGNFSAVMENVAYFKSVRDLLDDFATEGKDDRSPEVLQAKTALDRWANSFRSSLRETFTTLYYPTDGSLKAKSLKFNFAANQFVSEDTIMTSLKEEAKYRDDRSDAEKESFRKEFEQVIFGQQTMPWKDLAERTARDTNWYWYIPGFLETMRSECILKGIWRDDGGDYIRKGPFPKEKTSVIVTRISRSAETGEAVLSVEAKFGDRVHYEVGSSIPTSAAAVVENGTLKTAEMRVQFIAIDSKGEHETGEVRTWTNELTLKSQLSYRDSKHILKLETVPAGGCIRYSTDGTNPKQGGIYTGAVELPAAAVLIQAIADCQGVLSNVISLTPPKNDEPEDGGGLELDLTKPAVWRHAFKKDSRKLSYEMLAILDKHGAQIGGPRFSFHTKDDSSRYLEISAGDRFLLSAKESEALLAALPTALLSNLDLSLSVRSIECQQASQLVEVVKELGMELKKEEVSQ